MNNKRDIELGKGLFINGQWLQGQGALLSSINPSTNQVVWQGREALTEQVVAAVQAAAKSQSSWAMLPLRERVEIANTYSELLARDAHELSEIISLETGKPLWESATEVQAMINKVAISVQAQTERAGTKNDGKLNLTHRAHGVVAVFGPYNFPGHLPNGHIVPALLAGNAVVFKPSDQTPWSAEKVAKLWQKAGIPDGVLNLVQGGVPVGKALAQANIQALLFTGSSEVGRILHREFAGRPEVLLALEMGGNNPLIVDADVDIHSAATIAIQSAYLSAGQRCTCARRLILVNSNQSERFIEQLESMIDRIIVGPPSSSPEAFMGPVINQHAAEQLVNFEQTLASQGASILKSMSQPQHQEPQPKPKQGTFLKPGLIDVTDVEGIEDKEWFGPLLQLYRVPNFKRALELANQTQYGLAAGLVSDNKTHQSAFLSNIKAGVVSINAPTAGASSALPFGGVGASGNHRPSAYYAADYCAWPQAQTCVESTNEVTQQARGIIQ